MPFIARIAVIATIAATLAGCATVDNLARWWNEDDELPANGVEREQGPRVRIDVQGVDGALADNVRAMLVLATEPCDAPDWRVEREFARSEDDVRRALRAFGHYRPEVTSVLRRAEGCWLASYELGAGPRVLFGDIDVRIEGPGADDGRFAAFLAAPPVATGEPLDHGRYEGLKRAIESIAAERGFFDGRFVENRLAVDVAADRADVTLVYATGPRYRLGDIRIEQTAFEEDLVGRMTQIESGDAYDSAALAAQNRVYGDSGYFSDVDISPRLREARTGDADADGERSVPVGVTLTPRPKHAYSAGLGYATDTGPRVRLGYENRRLNRLGHRWSADAAVSTSDSEIDLGYRIPLADP
ncbi:MAG: hypothetical protein KDC48_22790, partial [Planctomycetes bacterium]|nr:hypothetical protein [Planctomycetota bacterium]